MRIRLAPGLKPCASRARKLRIKRTKYYIKRIKKIRILKLKILKEKNTKKLKSHRLDKNSAYILGTILGDGHFSNRSIYVCSKDLDFLEGIKTIYENWSDLRANIKKYKTGRGNDLYYVFFNSVEAVRFFRSTLINKMKSDKIKGYFLRGLFDAEGTVPLYYRYRKDRGKHYLEYCIQICNTDLSLITTIKRFLKDLNIDYSYRNYINKNSYGKLPKHVITIKHNSILSFYNKIGFGMRRKKENLEKIVDLMKQRKLRRKVK